VLTFSLLELFVAGLFIFRASNSDNIIEFWWLVLLQGLSVATAAIGVACSYNTMLRENEALGWSFVVLNAVFLLISLTWFCSKKYCQCARSKPPSYSSRLGSSAAINYINNPLSSTA